MASQSPLSESPAPTHGHPRANPPSLARPSPSLSPSITSLLNSNDQLDTPFSNEDYFAPPSQDSPHPQQHHQQQPTTSPTPSPSPSTLTSLLAPEPAHAHAQGHAPQQQPRPRSSHKRPRPTSSSGSLGTPAVPSLPLGTAPLTPSAAARVAELEAEGTMEPPSTRMRRSSSISSNPPAPPPPAPAPASASASAPSQPGSLSAPPTATGTRPAPPPPPPAPAAAAAPAQARLEPSIFNVEPIDEFTREVADWLWGFCAQLDWDKVEVRRALSPFRVVRPCDACPADGAC